MTTKPQSTTEPPDSIWLPADTDADAWNILAKNPSRDWSTGEPANNIEYRRVTPASAAPVVDETALKKRARQIIDAVIESPVIVEVRAFSQPIEVDKLEERVAALLRDFAVPVFDVAEVVRLVAGRVFPNSANSIAIKELAQGVAAHFAAATTAAPQLHWPFSAKHQNCAECDKEYEAPPTAAPVEQSDEAANLLNEIDKTARQLLRPNRTPTDIDFAVEYIVSRVAALRRSARAAAEDDTYYHMAQREAQLARKILTAVEAEHLDGYIAGEKIGYTVTRGRNGDDIAYDNAVDHVVSALRELFQREGIEVEEGS